MLQSGKGSAHLGPPAMPFPPADAERAALHRAEPHLEKSLQKLQLMTQILSPH